MFVEEEEEEEEEEIYDSKNNKEDLKAIRKKRRAKKIREEILKQKEALEKKKEMALKKKREEELKKQALEEERRTVVELQKKMEVVEEKKEEENDFKEIEKKKEAVFSPTIKTAKPLAGILILLFLLLALSGLSFFFLKWQPSSLSSFVPPLPEEQSAELPSPPAAPTPTHKECRGQKCEVVEGEGVDLCQDDTVCQPPLPPMVIGVSEEIELSSLSSDVFISLLDEKFKKEYPPKTFIEIVPKYQGKLLTISQLFEGLDLHPPQDVKDNLETYTLYLYSQEELFSQERRNRLGIAFKIKEGKTGVVRVAMAEWEKVLPDDFLKVHTLWQRGEKASSDFLNNTYAGIPIRYTNFPVPDLSIDWAIKNDILLITTSRESMWRTIDVLK